MLSRESICLNLREFCFNALEAIGPLHTVAEAAKGLVRWTHTYYPSESRAEQYDHLYDQYKEVYQAIRAIRKDGNTHG